MVDISSDVTSDAVRETMTLLQFFKLGGWAMWPLLIFSVFAIGLVIERTIYLFSHNLSIKYLAKNVIDNIQKNKIIDAIKYCMSCKKNKIAAPIIQSGLELADLNDHIIEKSMETAAAEKINDLERGFNFLVAIGSLAPITGFLGTVSGMIGAFQSIANASDINAQLVAGGIFEALITTAFGLSISIVTITFYNIFSHFVDNFSTKIEELGGDVIKNIAVVKEREGISFSHEELVKLKESQTIVTPEDQSNTNEN